jgi:virginiamycin B lyase
MTFKILPKVSGPALLGALLVVLNAAGALATAAPVSGSVADEAGKPIAGATVYATHQESGIIVSRQTDKDGKFTLPLIRTGAYELKPAKKGHSAGDGKQVDVKSAAIANLRLSLKANAVFPADQLTSADIIPLLPELESEAGARTSRSCAQCHSISALMWRGGRTKEDWTATVDRMSAVVGGYFPIRDEHKTAYVEYLTKYLGPDSKLPAEMGERVAAMPAELPIGSDVVFTEYEIPTPLALAHTAVPDKRGSVWFASFGGGNVGRLDIASGKIREYTPKTPDLHPHGITVAPDGTVWYTAMPYGIGRIDPKTGAMEEFKAPSPTESARNTPHTIIVARDGAVWFTELGHSSITRFDPATKKFRRYQIETRSGPYGILEGENNVFWFILSGQSKVGYLNYNTGQIRTFPTPTKAANPQRFRFGSDGRIWFGEYRAGKIGVFDPKTEKFSEYDLPKGGSAYCLHIDDQGRIWIASTYRESLIRFDPATKAMVEYPLPGNGTEMDMLGAIIRDIWPDEKGRMWFVEWSRNKVASAEIVKGE